MSGESKQRRIEHFVAACRRHGLPVTTQRRAVLEEILGRADHPTADQIYDTLKVRLHGLSRTTVYRILETLVALKLVVKICHPGSAARFDPRMRRHDHLVCSECERIIDIQDPRLDGVPWPDVRRFGFEITEYHIHFRGRCADCIRKGDKGRQRASKSSTGGRRSLRRRPPSTSRTKPKQAG